MALKQEMVTHFSKYNLITNFKIHGNTLFKIQSYNKC